MYWLLSHDPIEPSKRGCDEKADPYKGTFQLLQIPEIVR